jgi:hypothetical protein
MRFNAMAMATMATMATRVSERKTRRPFEKLKTTASVSGFDVYHMCIQKHLNTDVLIQKLAN